MAASATSGNLSSRRRAAAPLQQPHSDSDGGYADDFHTADAADASGEADDRFPARYGDGLATSISSTMPIPTGAGQLARAVAQAALNARAVARDKRRRAKREEQRMMQRLREAGLAGEEAEAALAASRAVARATPLFGDELDAAAFGVQSAVQQGSQQITAVAASLAAAAALPAGSTATAATATPASFPAPKTRRGGGGGRSPRRGRSHKDLALAQHMHSDVEFGSGSDAEDARSAMTAGAAGGAPRVDAEVEQINAMSRKRNDEYKEAAVATAVPSGSDDAVASASLVERSEDEQKEPSDAAPAALASMSEEEEEGGMADLHRDGDSAAVEAALAAGVSSKLHSLGRSGREAPSKAGSMSVSTAGLTSSIAHSLRSRARNKSIAVQAHAQGIHGVGRMSRIGSGTSGAGGKPTSNAAAAFLAPSGPTRNANRRQRRGGANAAAAAPTRDDSAASLSSLLHTGASAGSSRYQLSEEERKISAYYATIQNAATKVSASLDALLPVVGGGEQASAQDPEALAALWSKQGASAEEIRIRLEHRLAAAASSSPEASAPPNEHDAYRKTFAKLTALLNSLSTASLTAVGRGGVDLARNNLNATEHAFREFQEEQEAATALARRQKEEAQAAAAAAAAAAAQGAGTIAGATDTKSGSDSDLDSEDSSDSEDEEALLAATLRGESTRRSAQFKKQSKKQRHQRRASVSMLDVVVPGADTATAADATPTAASSPTVTLANPLASPVVAGCVSTPSSFGADVLASVGGFAGALQLSASDGAGPASPRSQTSAAAYSAVDHSAASIYRDLHSFFLGKRRSELIDSKRLHLLETQAALVEEAGESSRAVVQQVMSFKLQKTDQVLSNYHRHLMSTAGQLSKMMLRPPPSGLEWGADGESDAAKAAAAAAAKQRATGSSNADEATQRLKLELVVAMLQARVAEQDELLASIGVVDPAAAAAAPSSAAVQYTYDANPHLSRSFELKSARLLSIVSGLSQQLKARQEVRHRLQDEVDRQRDAIARLLQFEDQAAMDAKIAAQAAARDAEIAARHAASSEAIRKATAEAEAKFQEVARKNHAMTLTLSSVESELGALHALREAEGSKIAALRLKHKKDCIQIMRGVVPKHLRSLMSRAQKDVVHYQPGSGSVGADDAADATAPGAIGTSFDDPESMRPQLMMQDDEVRKDLELREAMTLADWEAAEAREAARKEAERNPPPNPPTAEEIAAAEAARLEAEAAAALEAERALTPFSSCRLRLERLYAEVGSQEMVYIPWQEELYLTLQPQVNRLQEEIAELQARRKIKAEQRREWEEKAVALAAAEAARLAEEAARKQREAEEADADSVDSDPEGEEGDEAHSELKHDSATLAALAAAQGGKILKTKVGPKSYPKRAPKIKSYLANSAGAQSPRKGGSKSRRSSTGLALDEEEDDEITSARFLTMGNNEYVKSSIGSFKLSKTLSNSALQQHILALKAETATLSQSITNLMSKWTELAETDARVTRIETAQIAPTRKRITVVKAHLARIEAAIEAKVKWMAQRDEAQRVREAEMKELDEKLRAAERAHQESEVARREAERLAKQAALQAGSDQIPEPSSPPPSSQQHDAPVPAGSPKMTPLKIAARSRRPSIHGSPHLAAATAAEGGFAAPTVSSSSASRERSRRPSVSLTPNLAPATASGAPAAGRHSRTPSSMGRSGAGGKHRRSLKREEMAELALNVAAAAAAAAPLSPHRSPTAPRLEVVVPSTEADNDPEGQVIMLVDAPDAAAAASAAAAAASTAAAAAAAAATEEASAQLAARNAKLLEETAALERELAQLELEQEALEFEQQQQASEAVSHRPSPLAGGDADVNSEPPAPIQWGSSLASRIAPPSALKVAASPSKSASKGTTPRGRAPTTKRSSDKNSKAASPAQPRRPPPPAVAAPLTALQQSSLLFVAPSLADPPEGDAATVAAAAAAVEYENSKQLLGAYEQLKLDMARWKEEARLKAEKEKANVTLPAVKAHTTLETIEAEQDAVTESDAASTVDPASSSSLASLSKPTGPLPTSAPRWAPGPAIVALSLPPEVHAPASIVSALLPEAKPASTAKSAHAKDSGSATTTALSSPSAVTGAKKKVVRTVNIGLPGSVAPAAPASAAVLSPNKLSGGKHSKDLASLAPSESQDEASENLASTQHAPPMGMDSLHPAPARIVDMSLPPESDSMLNSGPVRSPQKMLRSGDHNATVSAASIVLASPGHATRQAALGGAMADYSCATGADQSNAAEVIASPQAGAQRRRAAAGSGSRIGAAEQRLLDLPPFSAHAMSIPALAASEVATSARRSIAHPGSPSPIKAPTKGRRRSGEIAAIEHASDAAASDGAAQPASTSSAAELLSFASTKILAPRHPGLTSKRSSLGSPTHVELPFDGAQQSTSSDAAPTTAAANDADAAAAPTTLAGSVEAALTIAPVARLKVQSIDPVQSLPQEASLSTRPRSAEAEQRQSLSASSSTGALDPKDAQDRVSKRSSVEVARETALVLGGAVGSPIGAALSVVGSSKPVVGGGLNLASLLPHQSACAGAASQQHQQNATVHGKQAPPVLFVSAAAKPIQPKPSALLSKQNLLRSGSQPLVAAAAATESMESAAADKIAEETTSAAPSASSEETFVVSSQPDAAPLSLRSPMRHATSSSSLAHGPREPVHMSTTNLGALLDRPRGRPVVIDSTELTSASSPLAVHPPSAIVTEEAEGADTVIPMGTPSFSSPLPTSFQPKVAAPRRKDDGEHAAAAAATEEANRALARSHSAVAVVSPMLPQRSAASIPSSTRHAGADAAESSGFAAFISSPSTASLRASSSLKGLEGGTQGSPRQRSVSPPQQRRVSQLSSAGAAASSAESSVHVPLTSSASSGRLVPVSSTLLSSFVSARDRADAADHAALLHSFSRILSPQELHTVAEQAPRLQLQGLVTHASAPAADHSAAAAASAATRRAHVSPERRLLSTTRPSLTGVVASASSPPTGSSSGRGRSKPASKQQHSGKSAAPGAAANHLNNVLRVQASSVVSSGARNAAATSAAAAAVAASEPALHADITAYLASLHAAPPLPTKPASSAPSNAMTSPRTQRHNKQ